ncbi:flavodoxin domain-containing protein, partial [Serratia sp. ME43]
MATVGIFFGSDTGNTENIAKMIQKILQKQFGDDVSEVHDIAKSSKEDLEGFDILLLGIPTWYYGEAQCDWDDFFPTLEEVDFNGKLVA